MAVRIKAACVAVTLAAVLLGATTVARADQYGLSGWGLYKQPTLAGAPSPEIDTLLGFLVVAGTVAFIKRRRGGKAEAEDAAA